MKTRTCLSALLFASLFAGVEIVQAEEILPPVQQLTTVRPRLLVRGDDAFGAVPLSSLRSDTLDSEYAPMLDRLRQQTSPACRALLWLMLGDSASADSAVATLKRYRYSPPGDIFDLMSTLVEYGLAYDWVHDYGRFSTADRYAVRMQLNKLALTDGLALQNDHIFHNYIWNSAWGSAIWALAVAGEDAESDQLYATVRAWLNDRLYPGIRYLDGLPSESLGYWTQYDFSGAVWPVLAAQSASGQDIVGRIANEQGNWLKHHYFNEIHSVLPDMRFLPWGDVISGPNGAVTHEIAGVLDAMAWALDSGEGVYFSRWLAAKRGTGRFYGVTANYYFLYTKHLNRKPVTPALSFTAGGGDQGGHFLARSAWNDSATVVGYGVKDHYGDHNHYDQGGFTVYRNSALVADPTVYKQVNGPQQPADVHSTLLLNDKPQNPRHGQDHGSLESFMANLDQGQLLDTGDFLFSAEGGDWAAASGQYAQAYPPGLAASCVRQFLFLRPGTLVVVDQLRAANAGALSSVDWLLQLAASPSSAGAGLAVTNGKSWLLCRPLYPDTVIPSVKITTVGTWRADYHYAGGDSLLLVHSLEVGDGGAVPDSLSPLTISLQGDSVRIETADWIFSLARSGSYGVNGTPKTPPRQPGDVNGDARLDIFDLLALLKELSGAAQNSSGADVNDDGKLDIFDLLALLRILA